MLQGVRPLTMPRELQEPVRYLVHGKLEIAEVFRLGLYASGTMR